MPQSPTDAYAFLSALRPYMEAFVERNPGRRLVLLRKALVPQAEICGPSRVFAGYAEISEKRSNRRSTGLASTGLQLGARRWSRAG